jgi:hypothetical protein
VDPDIPPDAHSTASPPGARSEAHPPPAAADIACGDPAAPLDPEPRDPEPDPEWPRCKRELDALLASLGGS